MRHPYIIALLNPVNLAMLALTIVAGLCSAWWMFPVGMLLWGGMVLVVANNPILRASQKLQARQALSPRFQSKYEKIERVLVTFLHSINAAPGPIRKALQPVQNELEDLVDEVYNLCQRTSGLENYRLVSSKKNDLEAEWITRSREIENTSNPEVKKELQEALNSLEQRIGQQRKIIAQLEQIDAQLSGIENSLESLLSEVLRLQAMGKDSILGNRPALINSLKQLLQDIRLTEHI